MSDGKQRWLEAFTANPDDARAFTSLEEQYFLDADWAALAGLYRARLQAASVRKNGASIAALHFRLAQILEERLHDIGAAKEAYWAVLQIEPAHYRALRQLRRIHARAEDWPTVLEIAQIEESPDIPAFERAAALAELGEMWRTAQEDLDEALGCFERALAIDPAQIDALTGLARTREDQGRAVEAAAAWKAVVDHQRGPDRALALVRQGRLLANALGEPERASECFRRALTDDPRSREAVEALVEHAERTRQWPLLVDLLERRFDLTSGARRRTDIALAAARVQLEQLDNPAHARLWLARARELSPDDSRVHLTAAAVERRAGNRTALRNALEAAIAALPGDADPPLELLLEAAELRASEDDDEAALAYLRRASTLAPDDADVALALDRCLSRLCRDADRVDVLERRAALASSPRERASLLCEAARVLDDVLEDRDAAAAAWGRAFDADPSHGDAANEWIARLRKAERWDDLRTALERASEESAEPQRSQHLNSLGELALVRFDDPEAAARAFELALEADARSPRALEGLARIAQSSGDDEQVARAYAREALVTSDRARLATLVWELARIHEANGRPDEALAWLARLRSACPDDRACVEAIVRLHASLEGDEHVGAEIEALEALVSMSTGEARARACNRLAERFADLGREGESIRCLEQSLATDARQIEPTRRLVEIHRARGAHERRARLQRQLADLLGPGDEQRACLLDLAELLETQLDDVDGAAVLLWQVAGREPADAATSERLASLLERAGRSEELAQLLLERSRALRARGDDAARAEALEIDLERAELLTNTLGRHEEAAAEFRTVLERDADCERALRGLEAALRADRDSEGLAALLAERAAHARDAGERARAARFEFERAALLEDVDAGPSALARDAYAALAAQADDPAIATDARTRLEALLERAGDFRSLRALLERSLEHAPDDVARRDLRERLAALCRDRLSDASAAIEHLEAAGALDPTRASTFRALGLLYDDGDHDAELARSIEREIACDIPDDRALALSARAGALAVAAGDRDAARSHFERALALDAGHAAACEFLVDDYAARNEHEPLAALLEARIKRTLVDASTPIGLARSQRTSLRLRVAAVYGHALDDGPREIRVLRAALDELGPDPIVATPLADAYQRAEATAELAALARAVLDAGVAGSERAAWQLRLGDALRALDDGAGAISAYEAIDPSSAEWRASRAALAPLYRAAGRAEPLASLLAGRLEDASTSDDERCALHRELADLTSSALGQPDAALRHLRALLELEPGDRSASARAIALATQLGKVEDAESLLALAQASASSPRERADLLVQRAALLASALGRPDDAIAALRNAIAEDGRHLAARRALREIHIAAKRWRPALDSLFVEARIAPPDERRALLEQGFALAREHLSTDAALPWLERMRSEDPNDAATLARIADVHRQAGRPEALLHTIEQQLALSSTSAERARLHGERARILERDLGSPARALAALDAAHAANAADVDVLRELARLRGALGHHRAQVEALERLCALVPETARTELHVAAAEICADELADAASAADHFERAIVGAAKAPRERRAQLFAALADARRREGRTGDWARACERELELRRDDAPRSRELHRALAIACERELGALERALAHWDACAALADGRAALDEAEDAGIRLCEELRDVVGLEQRLARWLERCDGDAARALALARLREDAMQAPAAAARAYRLAIAADPESLEGLRGLRACAARLGRFDEVAATLDRELELRPEASANERTELLRQIGELAERRLGDRERAARAYRAAIELDPADLVSLRALERVCEAREEYTEALELYERECGVLGEREPERRREAWLRAGAIARDCANDPPRALAAYDAAARIGTLAPADHLAWTSLLRATGDLDRYCETFASYCDREDAGARADDHLRLADQLTELGREADALERTRRAVAGEPASRDAWDALARREDAAGHRSAAADALERAAALSHGTEACSRHVACALEIESEDASRAHRALRAAVAADPGASWAHAHLARLAEVRGELEEAESAAGRALSCAGDESGDESALLDGALRVEAALVAGRCALARGALEAASIAFGSALASAPDSPEALDGAAAALYAAGDTPGARDLLERRLALAHPDPQRAHHLTIIGEGLELAGHDAEAARRFREAIQVDARHVPAREGLVRALRRAGNARGCVAELEALADVAETPEVAARAHARAAEVILEDRGDRDSARAHLELACELDATSVAARAALAELLAELGEDETSLAVADAARALPAEPALRARVERVRAKLLETTGRANDAISAWSALAMLEPRNVNAALSVARLHRAAGSWAAASDALAAFAAAHPDPRDLELARVHEERARLLAGPLEDVREAIAAYEAALALDPERREARSKLASMLALMPGRERDAIAAHREILLRSPAHASSLRSLCRLAENARASASARAGFAILGALGIASPEERAHADVTALCAAIARDVRLDDPVREQLRLAALEARDAIDTALAQSSERAAVTDASALAQGAAGTAIGAALHELAPDSLHASDDAPLRATFAALAALALDPADPLADGDAAWALDRALGRRALRRVRKQLDGTPLSAFAAIDPAELRADLLALAGALAVQRSGGDLRGVLVALIRRERPDAQPADDADLCALVEACDSASRLLARVANAYCECIAREI